MKIIESEKFNKFAKKRAPNIGQLKKNKKKLSDKEKAEVKRKGAVWESGELGVWKAEVDGTMWYVCNTHRAFQAKENLGEAIKAFEFIKTTS